ncbi:TonB-dependent receptor [uncultured Maricaulis sp.]|uniref:TonB-dependent siderophore receptor n=1 Tax=uncultured Maricaulis sp. TaxID=174710 RepID=UPI0030DCB9D2|tara:strand:- start:327679 stop:329820 length:2142 start_codon:yes stop_codon:yes gene_type:complete
MITTFRQALACSAALVLAPAAIYAQDTTETPSDPIDLIVVTGHQTPYIRLSETATKTGQDLFDTPLSVSILNQAFLEDLRSETLSDAYPYTLGLSQSGTNANSFSLRGLPSDLQNVQVDGLPGLASRFGSPTTANIERVEVLKGPASVLYGLMEPGGLINIVTRRPQAERADTLNLTLQSYASDSSSFGTNNGATATWDSTGPLTTDERWLYRLIVSAEHIDSFRDGVGYDNLYIFPSLSWQMTPDALVTVGLEYANEEGDADDGLVAVNNDITLTAPINVRYQEDGDFDNDEGLVAFARLDYDLSADLRIRVNYRSVFHEDERKIFENNRVNDAPDPLDATLRRRDRHQLNGRQYHFVDANLAWNFDTGPVGHSLLVGLNGGFEQSDFERIRFGSAITPDISVFAPQHGIGTPSAITAGSDRVTDLWNYGVYLQDMIEISEPVSVMIGARYDRQDVDFTEQVSGFSDTQSSESFLPQGGIVYRATDRLSLYASYSQSFNPNSIERRAADGSTFESERGTQREIGVKASLWDERVNFTFAGFEIEKTNILERDLNGDWALIGALESRGVEAELQALPVRNWQFRLGYAYVDSIVSESPRTALIGARNAFAPVHDAFAWTRYNYPQSVMGGTVGVSLGVNYESERVTNASASSQVALPAYTRFDTAVYFETDRYRLALNIENLTDETYFTGGTNDTRLYPGDPRLMTLSLRTEF